MSDEISVSGLSKALQDLGEAGTRLDAALKFGVDSIALTIDAQVKRNLSEEQNPGGPHIGPPGGFPNRRTGHLASSIQTKSENKGFGQYEATVEPGEIYARRLETGAGWSVNYPYMRPTADQIRPQAESIFLSAVRSRWN